YWVPEPSPQHLHCGVWDRHLCLHPQPSLLLLLDKSTDDPLKLDKYGTRRRERGQSGSGADVRALALPVWPKQTQLGQVDVRLNVTARLDSLLIPQPLALLREVKVTSNRGPGCITSGHDWESHRVVHNWPSSIQVWPGLRHQAHKELYAYKQVIQKEKVKELNLHEICAVCLEEFKQKDELGICPCKHAFHRKCLIKWLEVRKVCPLCNMPVLQLAQQAGVTIDVPIQQHLPGVENLV
uniref:Ring finger protein 24 n=1 Tax=Oncorhynchus tshawytscha TaxID=74940 RepID=A0AAZ3PER1_ONCTS